MRVLDFPLLADENIHPGVIQTLRSRGRDIRTVAEEGLQGSDDLNILQRAHGQGRVVVLLRPGHISPLIVLQMLEAVEAEAPAVAAPFLAVAQRAGRTIRVRVRQLEA